MKRLLPGALGAALVVVGAGALIAPSFSTPVFGLPSDDPTAQAYMRAAGARDVVLGAIILGSLRDRPALRRALAWSSLIGLADAFAVFAVRGPTLQHVGHVGGFLSLSLTALTLEP